MDAFVLGENKRGFRETFLAPACTSKVKQTKQKRQQTWEQTKDSVARRLKLMFQSRCSSEWEDFFLSPAIVYLRVGIGTVAYTVGY